MSVPVISSASLNKSNYATGEDMILTVVGSDADEEVIEVTVSVRNKNSGASSESQVISVAIDAIEPVVTDSGGRVWTLVSRVGDTFTLKAKA